LLASKFVYVYTKAAFEVKNVPATRERDFTIPSSLQQQ
jgi:hypothetical protein